MQLYKIQNVINFLHTGKFDNYADASKFSKDLEDFSSSDEARNTVHFSSKRVVLRKDNPTNRSANVLAEAIDEAEILTKSAMENSASKYIDILKQQPYIQLSDVISEQKKNTSMSNENRIETNPEQNIVLVSSNGSDAAAQGSHSAISLTNMNLGTTAYFDDDFDGQNRPIASEVIQLDSSSILPNQIENYYIPLEQFTNVSTEQQTETDSNANNMQEEEGGTTLNIPSNEALSSYLKENTESSKLCSFLMTGVAAIIDSKLSAFRKEMEEWQENISKQIEFLGNVTWGCEHQLMALEDKKKMVVVKAPACSEPKLDDDSNAPGKLEFPLENVDDIHSFEMELQNEESNKKYWDMFSYKLNQRSAKTVYSRRKLLKELMFTEYVSPYILFYFNEF